MGVLERVGILLLLLLGVWSCFHSVLFYLFSSCHSQSEALQGSLSQRKDGLEPEIKRMDGEMLGLPSDGAWTALSCSRRELERLLGFLGCLQHLGAQPTFAFNT